MLESGWTGHPASPALTLASLADFQGSILPVHLSHYLEEEGGLTFIKVPTMVFYLGVTWRKM